MRDDWLRVEAARPFLPAWLSRLVNVRALGLLTLALLALVIALRAKGA